MSLTKERNQKKAQLQLHFQAGLTRTLLCPHLFLVCRLWLRTIHVFSISSKAAMWWAIERHSHYKHCSVEYDFTKGIGKYTLESRGQKGYRALEFFSRRCRGRWGNTRMYTQRQREEATQILRRRSCSSESREDQTAGHFLSSCHLQEMPKSKNKRCNNSFFPCTKPEQLYNGKLFLMLTESNGSLEIIQLCRKAEVGWISPTLREVRHQEMPKQERERKKNFVLFVLDYKKSPVHFLFPFSVHV